MAAFAQDNDDEVPAAKLRPARPSSAPAPSMPRYTAPGPSSLSQRADPMEEDATPQRPAALRDHAASSPIMSPAPARPVAKTMRSATRVPTSSQAPQGAFNFSVPIPVNVLPGGSEEANPSQVGPTGGKRPMLEPQGEPSTPRGRAAKRRSAVALSEDSRQRSGRRRGPSPPSSVSS